jgi:TRAP-type C4-dicarboxylate transport system permease small subunit
MGYWNRLDRIIGHIEKVLLSMMLSTMIIVAFLQIVLRNFFDTGLPWGDSFVRYLVLWVGFIGAALATREGSHINIDVLSQWLPGVSRTVNRLLVNLFSCFICTTLAYASVVFIRNERLLGGTVFFDLPVWVLQLVLPATFALMALRYAMLGAGDIAVLTGKASTPDADHGEP